MTHKLAAGQKLWYVPDGSLSLHAREVTIAKVGRVWAAMEGWLKLRISLNDLSADGYGYSSPGRCYFSREEYETELALAAAWGSLRRKVNEGWLAPAGVTVEAIEHAAALLGLRL